ncbi:MAG TPA: class I SAM-dependent methyltransferase [Terriglobia bacterium]|nr:class I SAM-dependent methyltransferase [Terriglobia bacterium]
MASPRKEIWLRLRKSIGERGLWKSLTLWARHPRAYFALLSRLYSFFKNVSAEIHQDEFDRRFGVETGTPLHRTDLGIKSENLIHAQSYGTIAADDFHSAMRRVDIDYKTFTFIDLGSGKGRVLFLASDYPFAEIIGVEISSRLHAVAVENVKRYQNPLQKCKRIELIQADIGAYQLPKGPLFCFLYNPCEQPIMAVVIENTVRSLRQSPRFAYVVYFNPRFGSLWEKAGFCKVAEGGDLGGSNHYCVYSWNNKSAP